MQRYADAGIPVHTFPLTSLWGASGVRQGLRLRRLLRTERAEVVHSHDAYTSIYATFWARVAGVRGVIASRRSWHSPHLQGRIMQASRLAYRMADRVVGNSPSVARLVETEGGVPSSRVVTIPNFLDPQAFDRISKADRATLHAELGVPDGAFVIGIVARLTPVKDHTTLLRTIALLRSKIPSLHAILVGDGPERPRLAGETSALGLDGIVHFAGERPPAPNLHGLFDVSVLCSTSEAFPNSILEAMAASRPVVATNVGGNPDAVREGVTGLLVPAADPDALAAAIFRLYQSPEERTRFGEAGRVVARDGYGAPAVIDQVGRLYEQLAGRSAS
jgi:glycosyltransferase involved in cell wall biosynthesis